MEDEAAALMIHDAALLEETRRDWQGVEILLGKLQRSANMAGARGHFPHELANAAANLPFIHAMAVLNDFLKQLKKEGTISCDGQTLGKLVSAASKGHPPPLEWQDLPLIWECVDWRTRVAHDGELVPRADCWRYIGAVRRELIAWGVLS